MLLDKISKKYKIISEITTGGMGSVIYLAKIIETDENVCVKYIKRNEKISESDWNNFRNEKITMERISKLCKSNNIIKIYESFEENDELILIMEYINGKTLREKLDEKPMLNMNKSLYFMKNIIAGINELHNLFKNEIFYHRDIKPENIMISNDELNVKIIDFGISYVESRIEDDNSFTNNNKINVLKMKSNDINAKKNTEVYCTYSYTYPRIAEFVSGEKKINQMVDIFPIGVIFYELLTNSKPFYIYKPTDIKIITVPLVYDFDSLNDFDPSIPNAIENVIFKCLACKDNHLQYQYKNCSEILDKIIWIEENMDSAFKEDLLLKKNERVLQNINTFDVLNEKQKIDFIDNKYWFILLIIISLLLIFIGSIIFHLI